MEELTSIIEELKKLREEKELYNVEDNVLFDCAVRIYNAVLINKSKKEISKELAAKRVTMPITEKQRDLLENLNYKGNMDLTKDEARKMIRSYLEQRKVGIRFVR